MKISEVSANQRAYEGTSPRVWREYNSRTRVYFWPKSESIIENMRNRRSRPFNEYRKLLPEALVKAGLDVSTAVGARWSQKAGCQCGCSPGFILQSTLYTGDTLNSRPVDVHVNVV